LASSFCKGLSFRRSSRKYGISAKKGSGSIMDPIDHVSNQTWIQCYQCDQMSCKNSPRCGPTHFW
jgi:hypothetical protein